MTEQSDIGGTSEVEAGNNVSDNPRLDTSSMENAPLAMVITDPSLPDNPIVYVNEAFTQLTGYSRSSSLGRNCRFLQGEETEKTTVKELREAIAADDAVALDIVNYRADGSSFINSLAITPVCDNGDTIFFLGIQTGPIDAESFELDRRRIKNHLRDLQDIINDQVGTILATIRGYLGEQATAERTSEMLAARVESIAQLYDGVYQRQSQAEGRVRLGAYLGRVCSATHLSHRNYNVRLNTHFEEAVCSTETAAKLGLLLSEVLASAFVEIGSIEDDSTAISVSFVERDGEAILSVSDQATPIEHEILPSAETVGAEILSNILSSMGSELRVERFEDGMTLSVIVPEVEFPEGDTAFAASDVNPA